MTFDQQLRFDAGVSRIGAVMPELGLRLRVTGWLRTGVGYRLEHEPTLHIIGAAFHTDV